VKYKKCFKSYTLADLIKFAGGEAVIVKNRTNIEAYQFLMRKQDELANKILQDYEETEELHATQIGDWIDSRIDDPAAGFEHETKLPH